MEPASRLRSIAALLLWLVILIPAPAALALSPDQIALVVNDNVPQSRQLAEYYAAKRGIPNGRIISLKLSGIEQMSYEEYQKQVVPPIRAFLEEHHLKDKVTCLVTFYGVPFRVEDRPASDARKQERVRVQLELGDARRRLASTLASAEAMAQTYGANPTTSPATNSSAADAPVRAEQAMKRIGRGIDALPPRQRAEPFKQFAELLRQFGGSAAVAKQFAASQIADPNQSRAEKKKWSALVAQVEAAEKELNGIAAQPSSADLRKRQRQLVRENLGLFTCIRLLESQAEYLNNSETSAATDSELSLLWWDNYPRARWLINPLHYGFQGRTPPVLMVMRLDAPQPGIVRDMILASLKAEHDGLKGRIVLDSRGIAPFNKEGKPDGYGEYDQTIRNLAHLLQEKVTDMPLVWDDHPAVLPPHSASSVALYCGWYSLRHYIPECQFNTGAVGFHVASFEMVGLHSSTETGWVHGLLENGVVATMGPVAEPYLQAFPRADDFFPLLLTGKLPLAEVYWKTCPLVSWRMSCVGDPLYNPFENNPQLKVDDLPERLRGIFQQSQ